ncbi:metal-binding protein [Sphingomonas sp. Leaf231]|uniref:DUF1636 family protein n=1 Tax=Sphingomonas sp. Leaf231 TaxID=1736301 RepID=UPI0006FF806F|nr:DUF1636 domain-containing protein [Sphingomonas sp. Leaf231]KQN94367.1 metal-binding protein [Sphingomonas sp. Leaf231]
MLTPVDDTLAIVACNTCRFAPDQRENGSGIRGGAAFVAALLAVRASDPRYAGIAVQQMPCLFSCTEHCSVHLRAPGKVGYLLGRFQPDEDAARALLDYALAYGESEQGRVPFKQWPQGVKGHFIARLPPAGFVTDS